MESATITHTAPTTRLRRVGQRAWVALSGVFAAVMGVLPHVLHHAGPLAGAALFAGATGSLLFGAVGLVAATPLLLRLHRRSGGWRLPGAALTAMAVAFSLSTFVIGPAISGDDSDDGASSTQQAPAGSKQDGHEDHH